MRSLAVCLVILAVAILLPAPPAAAQAGAGQLTILTVPFISAGPAWYLGPQEIGHLFVLETNTSHLTASDTGAFAISFAPAETGIPGHTAIAPLIGQTSSRTIAGDTSYFFRDEEFV